MQLKQKTSTQQNKIDTATKKINGPINETGKILVKPVITPKNNSISQYSGLKFVQITNPNNVVKNPIADVSIHLFITNPGKSQLKILKILFNKLKLVFLKFL